MTTKADVAPEDIDYDLVVRMPPKRSYRLIFRIGSVRKATPEVVCDGGERTVSR